MLASKQGGCFVVRNLRHEHSIGRRRWLGQVGVAILLMWSVQLQQLRRMSAPVR